MKRIPNHVDSVSKKIATATKPFIETKIGKLFLSLVLLGPLTFIPTIYSALTAEDVRALNTSTWPLMIVINTSAMVSLTHNGSWQMRLVSFLWVVTMVTIYAIILVRTW